VELNFEINCRTLGREDSEATSQSSAVDRKGFQILYEQV
jgi:hypothetical protein